MRPEKLYLYIWTWLNGSECSAWVSSLQEAKDLAWKSADAKDLRLPIFDSFRVIAVLPAV